MIRVACDAGCKQQFTIHDFQHSNLDGGVEKTFFTCPHCQHEYVALYTDEEIRNLQEKFRKVQSKFANQHNDSKVAANRKPN